MKPAQSHLIEIFLENVKSGLISGKEIKGEQYTSGPEVLQLMVDALQDILDGKKTPQQALKIKRAAGQPAEDKNFTVALIMHAHRKAKDKKPGAYANDWLEKSGEKTLSDRRLREIYKQHREKIEQLESIKEMIEKTQGAVAQDKEKTE